MSRFGSDLDATTEKKPKHNRAYVEVFSIEKRSKDGPRMGCEMFKLFQDGS